MRFMVVLVVVGLGGCAGFPTSGLEGPAARCMQAPPPLPEVATGTDLVQADAQLRRNYVEVASRLKCGQRYIHTVTK